MTDPEEAPGHSERRRHPRVDVEVPVGAVERAGAPGPTRFSTVTLNLSAGGVKLRVPVRLEVDTEIHLTLHLPDGILPPCRARVVRSGWYTREEQKTGAWVAAEFVDLPEESWIRVAEFVSSRLDLGF